MTTIIKAAGAAQFLSMVPSMMGYQPKDSIVIVLFNGARSMGAMRFDVPPAEAEAGTAHTMMGLVFKVDGADGVAIVSYSENPSGHLAASIAAVAESAGYRIIDMLYVTSERWGSHVAVEVKGPLSDLGFDQADKFPIAESQHVKPLPDPIPGLAAEIDTVAESDDDVLNSLAIMEEAASGGDLTLHDRAVLAWCFERPSMRDILLMTVFGGTFLGMQAAEAQIAWEDEGTEYPVEIAQIMWGQGPRPDPQRLERALEVARSVASNERDGAQPGALAVAGWLSWALGRSTHASDYVTSALEFDDEHGLSQIIRSFIAAGHLPDWAFTNKGEQR